MGHRGSDLGEVGSTWLTEAPDADLSVAAQLLADDPTEVGRTAAALLLDVEELGYGWDFEHATAVLMVPQWLVGRFTDEVRESIRAALDEEMFGTDYDCQGVIVRRTLPKPSADWRERVAERLGVDDADVPTNQGRLHTIGAPLKEDGLLFRSEAELRTYRTLKRLQVEARPESGMTIAPNAAVRVRDHTWEVDFIVTYQRRSGVIEIDGPVGHRGRRAADRTRDKLLEDAGFAYVDRIAAETTDDEEALQTELRRFLRRLKGD